MITSNPELNAALSAIKKIDKSLDETIEHHENMSEGQRRLRLVLWILSTPFIISGFLLGILCIALPDQLWQNILIFVAVLFVSLGFSTICVLRGKHNHVERLTRKLTRNFCRDIEKLISKEKQLRKMDHALKLLIFMEALKSGQKLLDNSVGSEPNASNSTKSAISNSIQKLRDSIQVDVTKVIKEMLNETDESKQIRNVDFIFRVCIPLYFLTDISRRSGEEYETIQAILLNAQYQLIIKKGLGEKDHTATLNQVFSSFVQNPNDSAKLKELSQIYNKYTCLTETALL